MQHADWTDDIDRVKQTFDSCDRRFTLAHHWRLNFGRASCTTMLGTRLLMLQVERGRRLALPQRRCTHHLATYKFYMTSHSAIHNIDRHQ